MTTNVTLKTNFLHRLHKIWIADLLDMEEYMEVQWMFMLRNGVQWKEVRDLDIEHVLYSAVTGQETEAMFIYYVNDKSKDVFENFARVCDAFMDFSKMQEIYGRAAT